VASRSTFTATRKETDTAVQAGEEPVAVESPPKSKGDGITFAQLRKKSSFERMLETNIAQSANIMDDVLSDMVSNPDEDENFPPDMADEDEDEDAYGVDGDHDHEALPVTPYMVTPANDGTSAGEGDSTLPTYDGVQETKGADEKNGGGDVNTGKKEDDGTPETHDSNAL